VSTRIWTNPVLRSSGTIDGRKVVLVGWSDRLELADWRRLPGWFWPPVKWRTIPFSDIQGAAAHDSVGQPALRVGLDSGFFDILMDRHDAETTAGLIHQYQSGVRA
jgi:hypothetical protein